MVSYECTVSPLMASILPWACWSMVPVKYRYIHYKKAGDQFFGRIFTGILSLTKECAIYPVYFEYGNALSGTRSQVNNRIEEN